MNVDAKDYLEKVYQVTDEFSRFDARNDIFNRAIWDDAVNPKDFFKSYDIANYKPKKSKGFDQWDFALRNASWHLTDVVAEMKLEKDGRVEGFTDYFSIQRPGPTQQVELTSESNTTSRIKKAAKTLGAGTVGVCKLNKKWLYSHQFSRSSGESRPMDLPSHLTNVIVFAVPMDFQLGKTFPAALSGTATGDGYAKCLNTATALAQFIINLGYDAVASMNDTAMNIPLAIQAGLGEYGRNGLLITPEYGPNVRIAKVFTNLPLQYDQPRTFGVKAFCENCRNCSSACPVKAIAKEAPQSSPPNKSSLKGITKWTVNAEKCFKFWVNMNTDCAICIRVCPYNKDYTKWWNRFGIKLANSRLRKMMLLLDDRFKMGSRLTPARWWSKV